MRVSVDEGHALEVLDLLLDSGAERAASVNRWGELPEHMASVAVAARLRGRGFAV